MVTIKDEWLNITQICKMMSNFISRESLRRRAKSGTAPFYMRRIGARYFARREDVEKYIKEINDATRLMHEQKKPNIKPVSILESFRKDDKTEYIHSVINLGYGNLNYTDWFPITIKIPEINARRKLFDLHLVNSDIYEKVTQCKPKANKFRAEFSKETKSVNAVGEIRSMYAATNKNDRIVFAFIFIGFELDIKCKLRANYIFVQNNFFGDKKGIEDWINETSE